MKRVLPILALCLLAAFVATAQAPANDSCGNATDITIATNTVFKTYGATQSPQAAYFTGSNDDDVWFKFTTGGNHPVYKIELTDFVDHANSGFNPSPVVEIWDGCSSASSLINGQGPAIMANGLLDGHTYLIRVYTNGTAQTADFKIKVTPINTPANNDCGTAITLTPVATCTGGEGPFTTEGATASNQASGDGTGKDDDVWFKFTTGADKLYGKVAITNSVFSGSVSGGSVTELWTRCDTTANSGFYPFAVSPTLGTLKPNTTYYLRVYTYGVTSWLTSFNICVSLAYGPPANDAFYNATPFAVHAGTTCTAAITGGTTRGANAERAPANCGPNAANDVWYQFTATNPVTLISLYNKTLLPGNVSTNSKMWMQLFDGADTSVSLVCSDNGTVNFDGHDAAHSLTIGHTYYLRIYNDDPGNACTFNLCTQAPPPPAYDECAHAVNIPVNTTATCAQTVSLTTVNATASSAVGECLGNVGNDVWLTFIAPNFDNLQINIQNYQAVTGISNPLIAIVVYDGPCTGPATAIKCTLGTTANLPALTHGHQYYIRIINNDAANTGTFNVCLHPLPPNATNIDCAHATTLNVSTDASSQFIKATTLGATNDNTLLDCGGHQFVYNEAVWFKFTAAATTQLLDIENVVGVNGRFSVPAYKVYRADGVSGCPTSAAIYCSPSIHEANGPLTGLTIGQVYFVQVLIGTFNYDDAVFDIRVVGATAPVNNESTHATTLIENPFYKASLATPGTFRYATISTNTGTLTDATYGGDVWYKFVAATTNVNIRTDLASAPDRIQLYAANATTDPIFTSPAPSPTQNTYAVTPGTLYYIRVYNSQPTAGVTGVGDFKISVFGTPSTDAANGPITGTNCKTADGFVTSTNSNTWLHLTDNGKMVASIFDANTGLPSGLGWIDAQYFINGGTIREAGTTPYLDRNYSFQTQNGEPTHPVTVVFYFTKAEYDRLVAAANSHVNFLNDLSLAAFADASCSNTFGLSGESNYGLVDYGALSNNTYYIEVSLPHFSGFFVKTSFGATLPVNCYNFTGAVKQTQVQLNWQTGSEENSSYFDVQRSDNGFDFSSIGSVAAAGNSNRTQYYRYTDVTAKQSGIYYYRLKAVDKDGQNRLACTILKLATGSAANELFGMAYPNPAYGSVNINIQKPYSGKVTIQVVNVMGQVLSQKVMDISNSMGQVNIPTAQLAAGAYTIRLVTKDGVYTKPFTKLK